MPIGMTRVNNVDTGDFCAASAGLVSTRPAAILDCRVSKVAPPNASLGLTSRYRDWIIRRGQKPLPVPALSPKFDPLKILEIGQRV